MKKRATKKTAARRPKQEAPQIFVLISDKGQPTYARASIRVKPGQYRYLRWRAGKHVKGFYLGKGSR